MSRRPERKLERKRKGKLVKKMERKLTNVKASSHRVMQIGREAVQELDVTLKKLADIDRQREVLLRVLASIAVRHGGSFEIPYSEMMTAPPILIETVKSDGLPSRVRITLMPADAKPVEAVACCASSHPRDDQGQVVDKACSAFEAGARPGHCVYCAHERQCHPGKAEDPRPVGRPL
jgi:hypothetical protein